VKGQRPSRRGSEVPSNRGISTAARDQPSKTSTREGVRVTRSQAIERLMVATGCVYTALFLAVFAICTSALRSCLNRPIEIRSPPNVMGPLEVLWWLVRVVLKAMFGISLE
jgi:hypothetical protein